MDCCAAASPSVPGRNGDFDCCADGAALTSNCPGHLFDQASNDPVSKPGNHCDARAFRKPLAVVTHHDHDPLFFVAQHNPTLACLRMSKDISQGFLNDAKDSGFQLLRQPGEVARLDLDGYALTFEDVLRCGIAATQAHVPEASPKIRLTNASCTWASPPGSRSALKNDRGTLMLAVSAHPPVAGS